MTSTAAIPAGSAFRAASAATLTAIRGRLDEDRKFVLACQSGRVGLAARAGYFGALGELGPLTGDAEQATRLADRIVEHANRDLEDGADDADVDAEPVITWFRVWADVNGRWQAVSVPFGDRDDADEWRQHLMLETRIDEEDDQ
jgi:hypothetical protein